MRLFLVTANVGSVFENIGQGLSRWMDTLLKVVVERQPEFVAVHFQETGGKNYRDCSDSISIFFRAIRERFADEGFIQVEGFVDSEAILEDQYTALSSTYFVHKDLNSISVNIWDFKERKFYPVSGDSGRDAFIGPELAKTDKKQKEKFPQDFFPDFKWSRKGFLRTRWKFGDVILDLVNIHLFHDSCNLIASSSFPSPFAQNRFRTLNYTFDKLKNDDLELCPMFIFGDFNFRLNTKGVLELFRKELLEHVDDELCENDKLKVDSKVFSVLNHEKRFKEEYDWVHSFEFEAGQFSDHLTEGDLKFHPTYPFDEEVGNTFMKTRCPAWCDRVLYTHDATSLMTSESQVRYDLIGSDVCMGDHKPVYLSFDLGLEQAKNPAE